MSVRFRIKGTGVYVAPVAADAFGGQAPLPAYDAASTAPRVARWRPSYGGPNSTLGASLPIMRARSRDAVRKDGMADGGLDSLTTNLVGIGVKPQFTTSDKGLNAELAALWLEWTDESDADGRLDFYGQQASAVRSMLDGGDVFGRLLPRPVGSMSVPLQIRLLESEFCPTEKSEMGQGSYVHQGVAFDAEGRRTGYYLYRQHPSDGLFRSGSFSGDAVMVAASEIVHMALSPRPGMIRGEPRLARALATLMDFDQYDDAQLVRQKIAALFAGFVHGNPENPLFGETAETEESALALAPLEPGTMQYLPDGAEINFATPPGPGESFEAVARHYGRKVARAIGTLYEQLTGDYSQVNDRTYRASVNEFRRKIRMLQHHLLVFQFCRPILRRWLDYAVLSGAIRLPAGVTMAQAARPNWVPEGFEYINPVQDVQAKILERRAGFRSRAEQVSERGRDIEDVDREIATENARADAEGLVFDTDPRRTAYGGSSQAKPAGSGYVEPGTEPDELSGNKKP